MAETLVSRSHRPPTKSFFIASKYEETRTSIASSALVLSSEPVYHFWRCAFIFVKGLEGGRSSADDLFAAAGLKNECFHSANHHGPVWSDTSRTLYVASFITGPYRAFE